jgi:isopentenyldiphosphate isomerase
MSNIEYKKSAVILVFNDKGELALQLRAANDDTFPLYWDFAAGGGIDEGEDEKNTASRELKEELGISAELEFITKAHYIYPGWKPNTTKEVDLFIYKARHNGPFEIDLKEIEKVEFFNINEIDKMLQDNEKFHPEFKLFWEGGLIR